MMYKEQFIKDCRQIREQHPLVHCITNFVAMDFNANALLAIGASPLMSSCPSEMEDLSLISNSLVVNIGCLDSQQIEAMEIAVKAAAANGRPWVLDPVGVGASALRNQVAHHLAYDCHPSVIRGNASEIIALAGETINSRGVDSSCDSADAVEAAKRLAVITGAVVSVSGPVDYITDGERVETVSNGKAIMSHVTGMGCTATALTGAFLAVSPAPFTAALHAMAMMGVAGDLAFVEGVGTGTFRTRFIDALGSGDRYLTQLGSGTCPLTQMLRLYLVTDRKLALGRDLESVVIEAVKGGVTMVQLREKDIDTATFIAEALRLKAALKPYNVPLIINDRVDVALAADADGVHIGQSDMPYAMARKLLGPEKIIGLSAENMKQVEQANALDVDYIGISPVFATPTKTDTAPAFGLEGLSQATKLSVHPTVGIGGMNIKTAADVIRNGADGIAVVSAIMSAPDPRQAAADLLCEVTCYSTKF